MGRGPNVTDVRAHFESKVIRRKDGHWTVRTAMNNKGYRVMSVGGGRVAYAHRVAYELFVGPIPEGLEIDHVCRTTWCCNPDHLEAVTHAENLARAHKACKRGHDLGAAGGVEHVYAHDVRTAREKAMEAESEVAPWHAAPSTHATGAAGQVFEHEPVTPERGPSFDLVIMDEAIERELLDPAVHAERLIRKYGGHYAGLLIHELDRILTEKGL